MDGQGSRSHKGFSYYTMQILFGEVEPPITGSQAQPGNEKSVGMRHNCRVRCCESYSADVRSSNALKINQMVCYGEA